MAKRSWMTLVIVLATAGLGGTAFARSGKHTGGVRGNHARENERHESREWRHDRDHDRDRDHHRHLRRVRDDDHHGRRTDRPRGWSRGRKTGWGDCDAPPGQATKHGCRGRDPYRHTARHHGATGHKTSRVTPTHDDRRPREHAPRVTQTRAHVEPHGRTRARSE